MIRIKEKELTGNEQIEKAEFNKQTYFNISDVATLLKEDLSDVQTINLLDKKFATVENINKGRKREELSDFNKKLMQAKHFKK